jgi:hypothetical protein
MSKKSTHVKSIKLASLEGGVITVSHLEKPYGEYSDPVASIAISLHGDQNKPEWQVHIPYHDLDSVIQALQEAKKLNNQLDTGYHPHDEMAADTGGGGA